MTRDEIMALVNETAPRYESWGCEAHFQNFARRLLLIEREACAKEVEDWLHGDWHLQGVVAAARIRGRGKHV
jgi:hypothetical protein